jgi:hypothetical protein
MPSELTRQRCKQITDQASEYLNFWLFRGLPLFALWAAIVYTSGVILHNYYMLGDVDFQIITSLTLSPFLALLLLYSWSLLTRDRLRVLGTKPKKPIQQSAWKFCMNTIWMFRKGPDRIWLLILMYSIISIAIDFIVAKDFVVNQITLGLTTTAALMSTPSTKLVDLITPISFILFILSCLAVLIMVVSTRKWSKDNYQLIPEEHLRPRITQAVCILPEKGRVGNTHTVLLDFDFSKNSKSPYTDPAATHLEVQLQAAGLKVDGERTVKLYPSSSLPPSIWSCCLSSPGEQNISLTLSAVSPQNELSQETKDVIFHLEHPIHVERLLTASWQPLLTLTLSLLSIGAAFVQFLRFF